MSKKMEAKIVAKEIIKPSSPTIKTFNLSFLDQQLPGCTYIKLFFFYQNTSGSITEEMVSERTLRLKSSLSEVLTHYYPLAGRTKDIFSVCTGEDYGAEFLEARVNGTLLEYIAEPSIELFSSQLVPEDNWESWERPLLTIQASFFACGALAIGINISHRIADIASVTCFVNAWASMANGKNNIAIPDFSGALIFPPSDRFWGTEALSHLTFRPQIDTRRFVFSASHIIGIQEKATKEGIGPPTRVQTISAFLWRIGLKMLKLKGNIMPSKILMSINIRGILNPSIRSKQSFGNLIEVFTVHNHSGDTEISNLVTLLREKIEELRKTYQETDLYGERCFTGYCTPETMELALKQDVQSYFNISSWCRFPLYDADFGWGKPIWIANGCRGPHHMMLMDTSDGTGIEAWVSFAKEDMAVFASDEELLAYATLDPNVI